MIAPEPAHHFRQNGATHFLAVLVNTPDIVHVVAFGRERFHHADVLIKPVLGLIVGRFFGSPAADVVAPVAEKDTERLLVALADEVWVCIASAQIDKTANVAQNLAEFIGALPCNGERSDGARTRPPMPCLSGSLEMLYSL